MSETIHATAVLVGADGVLIRGESGSGKSSLALALIERGARLIADDRLTISACHGRIVATAPAAIVGQIELRGCGVVSVPYEHSGVIRLIADIVSEERLERMPEPHHLSATLLGISLPRQPVAGTTESAMRLVCAALAAFTQPVVGACGRSNFRDYGGPSPQVASS
jgi:serine kinase of HPr protein (carbohydrate metabolism regulator)